jgi:hypothetical protein
MITNLNCLTLTLDRLASIVAEARHVAPVSAEARVAALDASVVHAARLADELARGRHEILAEALADLGARTPSVETRRAARLAVADAVAVVARDAAVAALAVGVLAVGVVTSTLRARLAELALRLAAVVPDALDLAREASYLDALQAHAHAEAAARLVSTFDARTPSGDRLDERARAVLARLAAEA